MWGGCYKELITSEIIILFHNSSPPFRSTALHQMQFN